LSPITPDYSPVDLTSRVLPRGFGNAWPWLQPLSKFPSTITSLHPMTSSSPPWSTQSIIGRNRLWSSRPRRSEAWDLTSDARLAFHFLTLVPNRLRLGRNPRRCSNPSGCAIFQPRISTHRLAPLGRSTVFQDFVTRLPSRPTRRGSLTLDKAPFPSRLVAALALPRLGPLPPSHCLHSTPGPSASVDVYASNLTRLTFGHPHTRPSEDHALP